MLRLILPFLISLAALPTPAAPGCRDLFAPMKDTQRLAWRAQGRGEIAEYVARESAIARFLEQAPVVSLEKLGGGITETYLARFADGTRAVFKPEPRFWKNPWKRVLAFDSANPHAEVDASRIDRALGLGVVPVTVARAIGGMNGSLQFFVEQGPKPERPAKLERIRLLDYLIRNTDRQERNILYVDGQAVAIDHGISFPRNPFHRGGIPAPRLEKIDLAAIPGLAGHLRGNFSEARARAMLAGRYSERTIREFLQRRAALEALLSIP